MTVSIFQVPDMHCASCVEKIVDGLTADPDIVSARANPVRRELFVRHADRVSTLSVLERIEAMGFAPTQGRAATVTAADRDLVKRLGVAGIGMMQVMMFAVALYAGAFSGISVDAQGLITYASLAFATPVVGYCAWPFFRNAWRDLTTSGGLTMDVPVAFALGSAYLASAVATVRQTGEVYFDSVVMFTFLLLLARYLSLRLAGALAGSRNLLSGLPDHVEILRDGQLATVTIGEVGCGDVVNVRAGQLVPLDGAITAGRALVDEASLTGEADWVERDVGEVVFAGTSNRGGGFRMRVSAPAARTRAATLARLADRAQLHKPPVVQLADRLAGLIVPGVLVLAALTGLAWWFAAPERAFPALLSVLIVTCPCALSLATPAAYAGALTRLRRAGLVLTRGDALDAAARIDTVVLDKTGTLTTGSPTICHIDTWNGYPIDIALGIAAALESTSAHPLARVFAAHPPAAVTEVSDVPGAGVAGRYRGQIARIGKAAFCGLDPTADAGNDRVVHLTLDGMRVARFTVAEPLRPDAADTCRALERRGLELHMISGDTERRCTQTAAALEANIRVHAAQTPEGKLTLLMGLQNAGARVMTVGDGLNDAPSLAGADVSIAVLESADLVKNRTDGVLATRRLGPLVALIDTARRTRAVIRQNLTWALGYNLACVPLAVFGLIPPWLAAIGMSGSSLLVMLNAARLVGVAAPRTPPQPNPVPEPA